MNTRHQHIASLTGYSLAIVLWLFTSVAYGQANTQTEQTIQYLLSRVAGSSLLFIRNNDRHPAREAAEHINNKYQHFKDAIKTPEDFIEKCATKSLLSGRYYQVIDKQGNTIRSRDWLMAELASYRKKHP